MPKAAVKLNKKEILDFLRTHKRELSQFSVRTIGLFGSFSRRQENVSSDIDFLVEFEAGQKSFDNFIGLIDYLESAFGKEIELVTRESVSKHILPYIEKDVEYVQIND